MLCLFALKQRCSPDLIWPDHPELSDRQIYLCIVMDREIDRGMDRRIDKGMHGEVDRKIERGIERKDGKKAG
jgi:hypothetical protein